jgi:hypothetical protein
VINRVVVTRWDLRPNGDSESQGSEEDNILNISKAFIFDIGECFNRREHKYLQIDLNSMELSTTREAPGSIPNSQELCTCSYPEPDISSSNHTIPTLIKDPLKILSIHLRLSYRPLSLRLSH